jgi:hypothetical protein
LAATLGVLLGLPARAAAGLPTGSYSLGHYELHVSLAYHAQASNGSPAGKPAPAPETAIHSWWNFTSQSESATLNASWNERLELNKVGVASTQYRIQPVHFPQAQGEAHTYEIHSFGSPGVEVAVNDSFTGTYYAPIYENCYSGQPCIYRYTTIPFTCTLNAQNAAVEEDLRTEWVEGVNPSRERYHGYYSPVRPGAVSLGISFAIVPGHGSSPKGAPTAGGPKSAFISTSEGNNSHPGYLAPTCPSEVNLFEPWFSESGLLSATPEQGDTTPGSRLVFFPLDTLIRRGKATSSFTGPAVSATGCCRGTTSYTLTATVRRVR